MYFWRLAIMYLNHSTKPALRFMREKIDPFVCFFILTQKKKNLCGEHSIHCYLCRHRDRPKEISVHTDIAIEKDKQYGFLSCRYPLRCLCVLSNLFIRGLMWLLAEEGKETGWKTPETKGHDYEAAYESQPLNGLQWLLPPGNHPFMKSPPHQIGWHE